MSQQLCEYLASRRGEWSNETFLKYRRILRDLSNSIDNVAEMTLMQFSDWLYSHKWSDSAKYVALKAVQGWLRWDEVDNAILKLKIKRREGPPQRYLKADQLLKLLESFNTMRIKGLRDLAMCAIMVDTGLRATEICKLDVDHLSIEECRLEVQVKGGRWAEGVYSETTARYLKNWLNVRKARPGVKAVFTAVYLGTQMTRQGLRTIIKRWGIVAEIGTLSPHDLRRTFAVLSTRAGAPGRVLQAAGRWSSLAMVERYTRAIEAEDMKPYFPVTRAGL